MAKITNQSGLTLGTNLLLHIQSVQGTDIAVTAASGSNCTLTSSTTDFTATGTVGGIVASGFQIGDIVTLSGSNDTNEGEAEVSSVAANSLGLINHTGTPANIGAGQTINVQRKAKTIEFVEAGGLNFIDGVEGSALHSVLVTLWNTNDLDRYDPPTGSIEPRAKAMRLLNSWDFHNASTINAIRGSAFQVQETLADAATKIYALVKAPATVGTGGTWRFWSDGDPELDPPAVAVTPQIMDQLVLILDSVNSIDKRGLWYFRTNDPGKTIAMQGLTLNFAETYTVTESNQIDPKLADGTGTPLVSDGTISAGGIYANIGPSEPTGSSVTRNIDGSNYDFQRDIIFDSQDTQTVHIKMDWLMRQTININLDGTGPDRRGDKQFPYTGFVGDVFTLQGFGQGFQAADQNNLRFVDLTSAVRSFNTIAAYNLLCPQSFVDASPNPRVTVWVADTHGGLAADAVVVDDNGAVAQQDVEITGPTTSISYAYSTFAGGGHTPGTDLEILVSYNQPGVAESAVFGPFTIGPNTTQSFQLSPTLDPSYVA